MNSHRVSKFPFKSLNQMLSQREVITSIMDQISELSGQRAWKPYSDLLSKANDSLEQIVIAETAGSKLETKSSAKRLDDLNFVINKLATMLDDEEWHPAHRMALTSAQSAIKTIEFVARRPLVVLDLNGVLLDREFLDDKNRRDGYPVSPTCYAGKFAVWTHPKLVEFLALLMLDYEVAIWSSAKSFNVKQLLDAIIPKLQKDLLFVWGQEECVPVKTDEKYSDGKPVMLFTKPAERIWRLYPQYEGKTIIIDDSSQKVQNDCLRHVKTWTRNDQHSEAFDLMQVIRQ